MAEDLTNIEIPDDPEYKWENYKSKFNKSYNDEEDVKRRGLFEANVRKILAHNKLYEEKKVTFTMGINQFSDLEPHEVPMGFGVRKKDSAS